MVCTNVNWMVVMQVHIGCFRLSAMCFMPLWFHIWMHMVYMFWNIDFNSDWDKLRRCNSIRF